MPPRAIIAETGSFPPGPHADGTLLIDMMTGLIYFWSVPANDWLAILRG